MLKNANCMCFYLSLLLIITAEGLRPNSFMGPFSAKTRQTQQGAC